MIHYGYIDEYNNWEIFNSKNNLEKNLKERYGEDINLKKFISEYNGILFTIKNDNFKFYGFGNFLEENNYLIRQIYKELSRNFSPDAKNITIIKFANNFKTKIKNILSYDDIKKNKLKKLFKIYDKIDSSNFKLSYGGFITNKGEIIKINEFSHLEVLDDIFDIKSYEEAYKKGFIRFVTRFYPDEFNITGNRSQLLKTFKKWINFALENKFIIIEIIANGNSANLKIKTKNMDITDIYNLLKNPNLKGYVFKEEKTE